MVAKQTKKATKGSNGGSVTIPCRAPSAERVFVAGTFNDWRPDATPMRRGEQDEWTVALELPPGRHEFKFVVDGQWCCEPGSDEYHLTCECVPNPYGSLNRVLQVP